MSSYYAGNLVNLQGTFTTLSGSPAVPSTITLKIGMPGTITTIESSFTNPSTGVYIYALDTTNFAPGDYTYRYIGTGNCQATNQRVFTVLQPEPT